MYVGYSKEHEALRDELRACYDQLLTPEVEDQLRGSEGAGAVPRSIFKQMSADGWVGLQWPKEWGGKELGPMEQFVFFDESMRAGAPVPMLTINSVAPTIMRFGSQEQKDFYIPKILAGEIHFAIGYTEADAGTDLAVVAHAGRSRRRRVRDQRAEDLHQPRNRRRLHLARSTHQHRSQEAQGHLDHHRADRHARLQRASPSTTSARSTPTSRPTKTSAYPWQSRRRGEPGLVAHHQPAQPRAGHAVLLGCDRPSAARRARVGAAHAPRRRPPGDRPGVGAAQPGAGARAARVPKLANWRVAWMGRVARR